MSNYGQEISKNPVTSPVNADNRVQPVVAGNKNASTQKNSSTAYQLLGGEKGVEGGDRKQSARALEWKKTSEAHSSGGSLYTFLTSICLLANLTLISHFNYQQKNEISVQQNFSFKPHRFTILLYVKML
jgi:hypothetical protein